MRIAVVRGGLLNAQGQIRWWKPRVWALVLVAYLRSLGLLNELCPMCAGHGRLLRARYLRRMRCAECRGTGYVTRPSVFGPRVGLA